MFVTHDQEEALELADRVVVMNHGRIEQVGTPDEVYHEPATPLRLRVPRRRERLPRARRPRAARVHDAPSCSPRRSRARSARRSTCGPHLLEIDTAERARPDDLRARVERIHAAGPTVKVELSTEGGPAQAEISQEQYETLRLRRGEEVYVRPRHKRVFAEDYTI